MLERYNKLSDAFRNTLFNHRKIIKNPRSYELSEKNEEFLNQYLNILKIFIQISDRLQGRDYTTIQYILPYIFTIRQKLSKFRRNTDLIYFNFYKFNLYIY